MQNYLLYRKFSDRLNFPKSEVSQSWKFQFWGNFLTLVLKFPNFFRWFLNQSRNKFPDNMNFSNSRGLGWKSENLNSKIPFFLLSPVRHSRSLENFFHKSEDALTFQFWENILLKNGNFQKSEGSSHNYSEFRKIPCSLLGFHWGCGLGS